ncbi:uncharacterized protein LOC131622006 [Vicia villosa]|uniref:uncharacterized protein LOC131622006 n=1 Tax=Vicia villosa TaxID=3911 RepID=UPI00273C5D1C|nr:uncharacterized protein LOC131622006 [Vicia villosa]
MTRTRGYMNKKLNFCYRAISVLLGNGEESHTLVRHQLIQKLKTHKDSCTRLYEHEVKFEVIYEALVPWLGAYTPMLNWMRFPEMRHLIACAYDRMCIDLMRYGFSKTFFPLRTAPPINPNDGIMCIGWLAKLSHFVQVYLKPGCPIPPTSPEWLFHHATDAETEPDLFVDRMHKFKRLNNIEKESNKEKPKL